jgi:hypothetical protein
MNMVGNMLFKAAPEELYAVSQGQIPWVVSTQPVKRPLPKIKTASELMLANIEMPAELIHGVLHKGLKGVLASSSKAGKTWLLLDMALSVASGLPWMKFDTTKAKVLVVNFEIPEPFLLGRIRLLTNKKTEMGKYDLGNLHLWTLRGLNSSFSDLLQAISKTIRNEHYGLVIIDPIYKGLAGADENKAGDVATLCNQFEALCVETGAALIYAHHFSKGNKASANPLDRMSGSGVFGRDADTIILLTDHEEPECYTVELILRNLPRAQPFVAQWEFPLMVIRDDLSVEDLAGKPGRKAVYDADDILKLLNEPMTHTEWLGEAKSELEVSRPTFNRLLKELKDDGLIEQPTGTKKWQSVSKSVSQPNTSPSVE